MAVGKVRGLVERIGGPDRLQQILHRFYQRLFSDPVVGFFFEGRDIHKIVAGQHGFLMRAFGETDRFEGTHPGKAHLQLPPIRRGQFDRRLQVLRDVLAQEGLDPADIDAWVKVEAGMRGLIQGNG